MIDYRGFGKSGGEIQKEEDLYKDAGAAYNYLLGKGVKSKDIIIWGQSLGTAVAIQLAQNKDVSATIIESGFNSIEEIVSGKYPYLPIKLLLSFPFRSDQKIGNIISPTLVIHSSEDEVVNISEGRRLFEKLKSSKEFLETKGSHNGGFQKSYNLYVSGLKKFLKL